jgi:glc operon protein GlcG
MYVRRNAGIARCCCFFYERTVSKSVSERCKAGRTGIKPQSRESGERIVSYVADAMTKLGIALGILATVFCLPGEAQTVSITSLDQTGAQAVLQSAKENAEQRHAPSAIAVVDRAGDLIAFLRMDGVRPGSVDLAIGKARTAARLQRPTAEVEDNINQGRTAFVTAGIMALRGGMPVRLDGQIVGAVGVAGLSKETDTEISAAAAAALKPSASVPSQH